MSDKATARPWKVEAGFAEGNVYVLADDVGECCIAKIDTENTSSTNVALADARLIVRAVNNAEGLAEALRSMVTGPIHCPDCKGRGGFGDYGSSPICGTCSGRGTTDPLALAREALAKWDAEGGDGA